MKVIIIRDSLTKTIINSYLVNDDVTLPPDTDKRLADYGYTHVVVHPILMNQAGINAELEDYTSTEKDMGKSNA